jgi:RNA polymerase sigma-70 factor (ECF subfamily)
VTTDAHLLRAARDDAGAFRVLYERYAARIHRFHLSRTRVAEAAHLTAETFARAWLGRGRFRDEAGGSAAPWLFGIARFVLLESVRKGRLEQGACERLGMLETLERPEMEPDPHWADELDAALNELPEDQRDALQLRVVDDLDYSAVAEALGTTAGAARVRVHRALSALRGRLTNPKEAAR